MVKKYLILALSLFNTVYAFADWWGPPPIITAYSENKEYMLIVYPIKYPENYFTAKFRKQFKKGIVKDTVVPCYAILYHIFNSDTTEIWNKPMVNFNAPVKAIVANDGKSVVTIDDWGMRGHTLVIYGEGGELIEDFKLDDISPFPLEQYFHSISSIDWGSRVEYLDNDRIEIYFRTENGEEQKRIFNIKTREFE